MLIENIPAIDFFQNKTELSLSPLACLEWGKCIHEIYNVNLYIIIVRSANKIIGFLPYYITRNIFGQKVFRSLKDGYHAEGSECAQKIFDEAEKIAIKHKVTEIILSSGLLKYDISVEANKKTTLLFTLNADIESLWDSLRAKTRNSVRKAEKEGIEIDIGRDYLDDFYLGYSERLLEKNVTFHPKSFFKSLLNEFGSEIDLIVAKYKGKVIGSVLIIYSGSRAIYAYNGTNIHKPVSPNQLLLWEALKQCSQRKCEVLDLSESSEGSGVYKFKKNFGGVPTPVYYYKKQIAPIRSRLYSRIRNRLINQFYKNLSQNWQFKINCWKRKFEVLQ